MAKRRMLAYDLIRVVAMLFVLLLHGMTGLDRADKYANFYYYFVDSLCFTCNALFFMLSGRFALMWFEKNSSFREYYLRRASTLLLPVLIFFFLRTLYDARGQALSILQILGLYISNVAGGYAHSDAWFLYTLTAALIAVPFVAKSFCSLSRRQHRLFVVIGLLWTTAADVLNAAGIAFEWQYLFAGWPFYFFLGYSIEKVIVNQKQIRLLWLGAAVSLAAIVALDYRGTTLGIHGFSPLFTCLSLGVYYACRELGAALDRKSIRWLNAPITFLARHSFSVYMLHGVLMQIVVNRREAWPRHVFSVFASWDTVLKTLCAALAISVVMDDALLPLLRKGGRAIRSLLH